MSIQGTAIFLFGTSMRNQVRPPEHITPSLEADWADGTQVVEWFRVGAMPFGNMSGKTLDQGRVKADATVASVVHQARALVVASEKVLSKAESATPDMIKAEIDRLAFGISQLECEREAVEIALAALKRRQRRQVS